MRPMCISLSKFFTFFSKTMRHIGIDMAKETMVVHIPPQDSFLIENNQEGFKILLSKLQTGDILGVESTSNYHHCLANFLLNKGFVIKEINPIITKQFIRATVRKRKTDKTDAEIISKLISQGEGHLITKSNLTNKLKKITRIKLKLTQMRSSLKVQLQALEQSLIEDKDITKTYQRLIKNFDKEIERLQKSMEEAKTKETDILESIPGISTKTSYSVLAEIGDINKFLHKKKLVAYAGYDPVIRQSGKSLNYTGKLTKRGTPYLRNALYWAAFANARSNNIFGNYYRKKRREGKHFTQAIVATSRKMLEIIYVLLKKQEMFKNIST